jgi:hypothetical protein
MPKLRLRLTKRRTFLEGEIHHQSKLQGWGPLIGGCSPARRHSASRLSHRSTVSTAKSPTFVEVLRRSVLGTIVPFGLRSGTCTNAKCRAGFQVAMLQGPTIRHLSDGRVDQVQTTQCDGFSLSVVRQDIPGQAASRCRSEVSGTGVMCLWSPVPPHPWKLAIFPPGSQLGHTWRLIVTNSNFFVTAPSRSPILLCALATVDEESSVLVDQHRSGRDYPKPNEWVSAAGDPTPSAGMC